HPDARMLADPGGIFLRDAVDDDALGLDRNFVPRQAEADGDDRFQLHRLLGLDEDAAGADVLRVLEDEFLVRAESHLEAGRVAGEGAARLDRLRLRGDGARGVLLDVHDADRRSRTTGRGAGTALQEQLDPVDGRGRGLDELGPESAVRLRTDLDDPGANLVGAHVAREVEAQREHRPFPGRLLRSHEDPLHAHLAGGALDGLAGGLEADGENDWSALWFHAVTVPIPPGLRRGRQGGRRSAWRAPHTAKRTCRMSPSCTTYSFRSTRSFPSWRAFASLPAARKSPSWITSAFSNPRSRSEWILPAARGARSPRRMVHAFTSSSP